MSAPETDRQDQRRRVQQYVERQRAYLPTYTGKHLFDERHGTPSKSSRSDEFGFDTPVLRPRVPVNKTSQSQLTPKAGPSKPQAHEAESRGEATRDVAPSKKDKPRPKRKKDPTPTETDNERAASRSLTCLSSSPWIMMTLVCRTGGSPRAQEEETRHRKSSTEAP